MTSEDPHVVDLYAICARACASPAGDLRPPDVFSIAPPCTPDVGRDGAGEARLAGMLDKPRIRLVLAGVASALLLIGLVIGLSSGSPPSRKAVTASAAAPTPPARTVEAPPALPAAAAIKLPPPPTTGASPTPAPPPRAVAMRKAPATPVAGPKMTKIRSDGTEVR